MAITPKSEDKYVEKCSTAQSFIRTEMSTYRIGTLISISKTDGLLPFFAQYSGKILTFFKSTKSNGNKTLKHNLLMPLRCEFGRKAETIFNKRN